MLDKKTWLVAQRELLENVHTKAFWIGMLFFPIMISLSILVPIWVEQTKEARHYAVVDRSGWLLEAVEERAMTPDLEMVFRTALEKYRKGGAAFDELPEALRQTAVRLDEGLSLLGEKGVPGLDEDRSLESQVITSFATFLTNLSGPEGERLRKLVPEEAAERLLEIQESVRLWWSELPPEEAEKYGARTRGRYIRVDVAPAGSEAALLEELNRRVADQELFAYFVIGEDPVKGTGDSKYVSANLTDDDLLRWFSRLATDAVRERRLEEKAIGKDVVAWIQEPVRFASKTVGKEGAEQEVGTQDKIRQFAPAAFVYLLWFAVFLNAQMLLTNTVEEKSNRIMEVLLSSVSPSQLMAGKIAGIAASGLMVVGSWAVFFYLAVKYIPRWVAEEPPFDLSVIATDPFYMGSFVLYFFLGYLFLSAVLVGIGSVCNSLKEAQNMMMPVTLMTIVPLLLMMPIAEDPNSTLAKAMSYFPPFTPFVMMNRAAAPPTAFEYVATTILMVASIFFVHWAAAKVFRIGILMTGKPPKPAEILKWIRAPVGVVPERRE